MRSRKVLKSVLWNFLGTHMSRYSDFDGYWLFGFLVADLGSLEFNLLASHAATKTPADIAAHLAESKFADQLRKAGIDRSWVRMARLNIMRSPEMAYRHGLTFSHGFNVHCRAEAEFTDGEWSAVERVAFVAPHDPSVERRSCRSANLQGGGSASDIEHGP